jgi:hypothetical protein
MSTIEDLYMDGTISHTWDIYIPNELYDVNGEEYLTWYGTVAGKYDIIPPDKEVLEIDKVNKYIVMDV